MFDNVDLTNGAVVIYDWDDTLFPTSHVLLCKEQREDKREQNFSLPAELSASIRRLLTCGSATSFRSIVTNATMEWLQSCADEITLDLSRIYTVSAREYSTSADVREWKRAAFKSLFDGLKKHRCMSWGMRRRHLICVSDSTHDHDAALEAAGKQSLEGPTVLKFVYFKSSPLIEELIEQQKLLVHHWNVIASLSYSCRIYLLPHFEIAPL